MKIKAYAKINLSLDVTGRREDGFHTLEHRDAERHPVRRGGAEAGEGARRPPGAAARTTSPPTSATPPTGPPSFSWSTAASPKRGSPYPSASASPAGRAWGAAAPTPPLVLLGLDQLFETHLGLPALMELGARVGADVPFCVHGGTCRCTGIGEVVEPVAPMPHCYLAYLQAPAGMSTPRAYALLDDYPPDPELRHPPHALRFGEGGPGPGGRHPLQPVRRDHAPHPGAADQTDDAGRRGPGRHDDRQRLGGVRPVRYKREGRKLPGRAGGPGQAVPLQPCAGGAEPLE